MCFVSLLEEKLAYNYQDRVFQYNLSSALNSSILKIEGSFSSCPQLIPSLSFTYVTAWTPFHLSSYLWDWEWVFNLKFLFSLIDIY